MFVVQRRALTAIIAFAAAAGAIDAQQPAAETGPKVGEMAPEFSLSGATRYGILRDQITLSSYRGNTVVLAFFFKARTRG
jgi:hypothetical protein